MTKGIDLCHLQEFDSEKDAAQRRLAEIERALGEDDSLKQARQALKKAEAQVKKWTLKQRDQELEIQSVLDKASRSEKRLYSGKVSNPKELSDLQSEIASLRRRNQKLEDNLLETMIALEEAEEARELAQRHLEETETQWSAQQSSLIAEREALEKRLEEIASERAALLPRIDQEDLASYQALRPIKGGVAVARLDGDTCSECGIRVTQALKWQLRQEGMGYCGNCERIIVRT